MVTSLQMQLAMTIALRWREEPFDCEFRSVGGTGALRLFADGQLLREEMVACATAAYERARELRKQLTSAVAREA
jgi:hypothetical protein